MTEKFKKSIDKGNGVFGALQNNLSNPFDCIDCTLLITKLFAFGVSLRTLMYRIELNKSKQQKKTEIVRGLILNLVHPSLRFNFYLILI